LHKPIFACPAAERGRQGQIRVRRPTGGVMISEKIQLNLEVEAVLKPD